MPATGFLPGSRPRSASPDRGCWEAAEALSVSPATVYLRWKRGEIPHLRVSNADFDPPTTEEEVRAAALQYVRKVSGLSKPSGADVPEPPRDSQRPSYVSPATMAGFS